MLSASNLNATNQTPLLSGHNAFRLNPLMLQIASGLDAESLKDFDQIGHYSLSTEAQDLARMADANPPALQPYDRFGNRIDHVDFHPSYHALMRRSMTYGIASSVWEDTARGLPDGHFKRALRFFMLSALEGGHLTSLSTTSAGVASLMTSPSLAKEWVPRVTTRKYDSAHKSPIEKSCLTLGLGSTEKQAGADINGIQTRAEDIGNGLFRLTGHKWFLSSPMADAFLMLGRTSEGISCFLVPRYLANDEHNRINLVGLKNKLGNRSAATAEAEINGAIAQIVGQEGEGARTIHEMQTLLRLDSAVSSASIVHASISEAVHHARHRRVAGEILADQPLMRAVLADLAVDSAAMIALCMRVARAFDQAKDNDAEGAYAHIMTPVVKYWNAKTAPAMITEAMEACGGNAYVENSRIPRFLREAPHASMWESSGNMMALEVCRVFRHSPALFDTVLEAIAFDLGPRSNQTVDVLRAAFRLAMTDPGTARMVTEQLAVAAAAAELMRLGTGVLADAFIDSRLSGTWRSSYGMLDPRFDAATILSALYPPVS